MILSFADKETEDLFNGVSTKQLRRRLPEKIWSVATRKLDALDSASILGSLGTPSGNNLEPLYGNRDGQHSIRINEQYRICFVWTPAGPTLVEVTDYH